MSITRFTTRMLAIAALSPQEGDADAITMAGAKVFDSRLDPIAFNRDRKDIPAIVIYTDEDRATLQARSANSGPFMRHCTLRVEISVGSFDTVEQDGRKYITYALPTTDSELEAKLDFFEQQVKWALMGRIDRAATNAFIAYTMGFDSIDSHPDRDESGNNKLASRRLLFTLRVRDDCPPLMGVVGGLERGPSNRGAGGSVSRPGAIPTAVRDVDQCRQPFTVEDFPDAPHLASMLVAMQEQPSYRAVLDVLSNSGRPAILVPLLKRLGVKMDAKPLDPSSLDAELGRDGRTKIYALWELPS